MWRPGLPMYLPVTYNQWLNSSRFNEMKHKNTFKNFQSSMSDGHTLVTDVSEFIPFFSIFLDQFGRNSIEKISIYFCWAIMSLVKTGAMKDILYLCQILPIFLKFSSDLDTIQYRKCLQEFEWCELHEDQCSESRTLFSGMNCNTTKEGVGAMIISKLFPDLLTGIQNTLSGNWNQIQKNPHQTSALCIFGSTLTHGNILRDLCKSCMCHWA
jgi:hypothetical protein